VISRIHGKLGTAGFIISIVALVAALGGGAYAASGGLSGKQKKEVEKIAKKVSRPGPAGAKGDTGPAGAPGAKGEPGAPGAAGTGTPGSNGKSVTVTSSGGEPGEPCEGLGGAEVKQEGAASGSEVCNGSPWTAGGTLPSNATETGVWGTPFGGGEGIHYFPASFPIRLAAAPEPVLVKYREEEVSGECPGRGLNGNSPEAEPGFLCLYVMSEESPVAEAPRFLGKFVESAGEWEVLDGASAVGSLLKVNCSTQACLFSGTWAVTAP
jgi:hypothetical protein